MQKEGKAQWSNRYARSKNYSARLSAKYLTSLRPIQNDNFGMAGKVKKLKKLIRGKMKETDKMEINYSTVYPMLIISYHHDKLQHKHLRQIIRKVPALEYKRDLIDDIFTRIYDRVDQKYHSLAVLAIQKAYNLKVRITLHDILNKSEDSDVMFYYKKTQNKVINFVVFDRTLRDIEFNSSFIYEVKNKYPREFAAFLEFYEQIFGEDDKEEINDILDNEEAESEDQAPEYHQMNPIKLQKSLQAYLNKDLSSLNEAMQKLQDEIEQEELNNGQSQKLLRLTEKLEEIQQNKINYEMIRDQVKARIQTENPQYIKNGLKKLIIAGKQLQSKLPIVAKKRYIFEKLQQHNLLIIEGETGSGKSTQLPQILAEYYKLFDNPQAKPVLVTQPRRLATRTLAERVAKEMKQKVGGFIDYVASAGKKANPSAKIIFKLDRLVLDQLTEDQILSNYSCLVIDEAHERTISIDVILGLIKGLLSKRQDFKIIVTSASMDIQLFESYFETTTLKVSGRAFPVSITYKDYSNFRHGDTMQTTKKIQKLINQQILQDSNRMKVQFKGHLLCFCSGIEEITELVKIYQEKLNSKIFTVLPLHGKISQAEQRKVFEATGKHKFIFASRIAETAITIDGVRVVIDPGQDIELVYDQKYKVSTMKLVEISQSSAKQRAGRSGRTGPGHCFRLYSEISFKRRPICKRPEMQNSSLESVVLRLKSLRIKDVINFPYISAPNAQGLKDAVESLTLIGALQHTTRDISNIGKLLVRIPVDPFLSRAIIQGMIFQKLLYKQQSHHLFDKITNRDINSALQKGLVYPITVILSLLVNFSNLFFIRGSDREKGQATKFSLFSDEQGDFFFLKNIYEKYIDFKSKGKQYVSPSYKNGPRYELKQWLNKNYLNFKALNQTQELVQQIIKIIQGFNIDDQIYKSEIERSAKRIQKCQSLRQLILSCLITSFSPNLCKYSGNPQIGYTLVNQRRPVQIYGTSNLSLLGIQADWIICYDLYTNQVGRLYCKVAHKVTFDFITNHTDPYIQQSFNIQKIQDSNPFYEQIAFSLPTSLISQIQSDFNKSTLNQRYAFLQYTCPTIDEQNNQVTFFIIVDQETNQKVLQKMNLRMPTKQVISNLKDYIHHKLTETKQAYNHNYFGNIYIELNDGFKMSSIHFNRREFSLEIVSIAEIIDDICDQCSELGKREVFSIHPKDKFLSKYGQFRNIFSFKRCIFTNLDQNDRELLSQLIKQTKRSNKSIPVDYEFKQACYRKKAPYNIFLHFFAGKSKINEPIMLAYPTKHNQNYAKTMDSRLTQAFYKLKQKSKVPSQLTKEQIQIIEQTTRFSIDSSRILLTNSKKSLKFISCTCDQFDLREYLEALIKTNFLHGFKFPKEMTKQRQPDAAQLQKTDFVWREQILKVLQRSKIPTENVGVKIKGKNSKRTRFRKIQKKIIKTNITAEISGLDPSAYLKLKETIHGKIGVLGSQKVHVRAYNHQIIAIPPTRVFEALEEEYLYLLEKFRKELPLLCFQTKVKRVKGVDRTIIDAYSPNRDDYIKPQAIISALFTPKFLKLESYALAFLDKMQDGQNLLDDIEYEYNFRVWFGLDRASKILKVYCQDALLKEIEAKVKAGIAQFNYYSQRISYQGKNLNLVINALDEIIQTRGKKGGLIYQISFQTREIELITNHNILQQVKSALAKIGNTHKGDCKICADVLKIPYRFINCSCVFCWHCVSEYLRTFITSNEMSLYCPSEKCLAARVPININDFKTLLSDQQFQKICDLKVKIYFAQNQKSSQCILCQFCDNIIEKTELGTSKLTCDVCDRQWCEKCLQPFHEEMTCAEWSFRNELGQEQLQKLGIKQCPQCNMGIQKNKGCNHMTCKNCSSHICWKCRAVFKTQKECYDHLSKVCGGIFDNGYVEA